MYNICCFHCQIRCLHDVDMDNKRAHSLSFEQWMKLNLEYVKNRSTLYDLKVLLLTIILIAKVVLQYRNSLKRKV